LAGELGSNVAVSAGISGRPTLISVHCAPRSVERNTWPPFTANPDAVITTFFSSRGDTVTDVSGRFATPRGVMFEKTGASTLAFLVTRAFGPVIPSELVTT